MKLALTLVALTFALTFASPSWSVPVVNVNPGKGHDKHEHDQAYHKFVNTSGEYNVVKVFGTDNGRGHNFDHSHQRHISTIPEPSNLWMMLAGLGLVGYMVSQQYKT